MGAFLGALGSLAEKGIKKGAKAIGQRVKNNLKPKSGGQQSQQPSKQTHFAADWAGKSAPSMKKGGRVRKTGLHLLHEGEVVVPAKGSQRKSLRKRSVIKA